MILSEIHKQNISEGLKRAYQEGIHKKIRLFGNKFGLEHAPWNKGLTKEDDSRIAKMGFQNGHQFYGDKSNYFKKGYISWNKGKHIKTWWMIRGLPNPSKAPEIRVKISKSLCGKYGGKNHPNWQGGKSFEPYGTEFNNMLKEMIRRRDNYICQNCELVENGQKLDVHHIDGNKKNNNLNNLITLCRNCHVKLHWKVN